MPEKVLLGFSAGKDSCLALHQLRTGAFIFVIYSSQIAVTARISHPT